ncbi:tetratricopeptide repeat protein (macronuclear) [Tetrahymena thermophila SB210]|uniref:Tetratricopeptide repeat protein n=1 Tax=Tetrahymena thermophila (strain SB210) TaxID=312017 RepID=I7MF11_TETTS|nr:tetratricopeptide repeat protein [Tetrahymena thermophila SB210]EAR98277.2 tetratricopeptide repeat protein [Tetrahymena thermophila SB210]|eukprot:XP_001018522.2 tetratricopeptide repeat protein [Tetrahymena thermophila SB210]
MHKLTKLLAFPKQLTYVTAFKFSNAQISFEELNKISVQLLQELKSNQDVIEQIVVLSQQYLEIERVEEAINIYIEALKVYPNSARLNCKLGTLFVQLEELEEGVKYLEKGIEIDYTEMGKEGLVGLASLYKMLNQNDKALETYMKSIELNYLPSYCHQFIALLYAEQQKFDIAQDHFQKSLEMNPNDFASQWAYGEAIFHYDQQKGIKIMREAAENIATKKCENQFMQEDEVQDMISSMNFRVGQILQHISKNSEEAKKFYRVCLKNNPNHVEAHVQYASCLKKGEQPNIELAEYHLQKAKEIDPSKFQKKLTEWW